MLLLFSHPVVCNSLQPHGLHHVRPPCPSSPPGTGPSSCSLHRLCHPGVSSSHVLFSFGLQSFPASRSSNESSVHISDSLEELHWCFSFSISPSSEYSGLISVKIDWFDLAVQGTFRSLLRLHSSKTSILWCSAFFKVQLSQLYVTRGETLALTI